MSQQVVQSVADELIVLLTKNNVPVPSLTFADVTAEYVKDGASVFTAKALTALNFIEVGDGVYKVAVTAAELDTVGSFTLKLNGATIDQYVLVATVLATAQTPTSASLETCIITGHLFDAAGAPIPNAAVLARVLGMPSIEQSQAVLSDDLVSVTTDATGEFFLTLVRLADVEIMIPKANYKRQLVVPNQATANLFSGVT